MLMISWGEWKVYTSVLGFGSMRFGDQSATSRRSLVAPPLLHNRRPIVLVACGAFNPPTYAHLRMFGLFFFEFPQRITERARDYLERTLGQTVREGIFSPFSDSIRRPDLVADKHRLQMLRLATRRSNWIRVDSWQCSQMTSMGYSQTLRHFNDEYSAKLGSESVRIMLLCGADVIDSFANSLPHYDGRGRIRDSEVWFSRKLKIFQLEEIVRNFGVITICRPNSDPIRTIYSIDLLRKYEVCFFILKEILQKNIYLIDDETFPTSLSSTRLRTAIRRGESIRYCVCDDVVDYIFDNNLYRPPPPSPPPPSIADPLTSHPSVTLDELFEISTKWADYFAAQLGFMNDSTISLPNTSRVDENVETSVSVDETMSRSTTAAAGKVKFNLVSPSSTASEPCLTETGRRGVRLKFRQYNLTATPETTV